MGPSVVGIRPGINAVHRWQNLSLPVTVGPRTRPSTRARFLARRLSAVGPATWQLSTEYLSRCLALSTRHFSAFQQPNSSPSILWIQSLDIGSCWIQHFEDLEPVMPIQYLVVLANS